MYKILKVVLTPILSFFFVIVSFVLIINFSFFNFKLFWIIFSIYLINIIVIWIVFFSKRRTEAKLSWIFSISVFPIIGIFAYFFYGRKYKYQKKNNKYIFYNDSKIYLENHAKTEENLYKINKLSPEFYQAFKLAYSLSKRGIYDNFKFKILENGEDTWINILKDIKNAKEYILMNYFIIGNGEIVQQLLYLLEEKISQNVEVYFLYDSVGTYFQNNEFILSKFKKIGVKLARFGKFIIPLVTGNVNYRNHRKDIIIDGKIGYTGGINIGDEYINLGKKFGFINDTHCRFEGECVKSLELIFMNDWYFTTKNNLNYIENNIYSFDKSNNKEEEFIQIIDTGPIRKRSIHKSLILNLINNSKKRFWISTPYFIPTDEINDALIFAASIGKDVRILLPGKTDKTFILSLSKLYASRLMKYGVKVYITNGIFNHSKAILVDDKISIISTTNLDQRSLYVDHQTMAMVYSKLTNNKLENTFNNYFVFSHLFDIKEIQKWNFLYKIIINLISFVSPIL